MKAYIAELIGTFVLVFLGTGSIVYFSFIDMKNEFFVAFSFGLAVFSMITLFGKTSGAHLNPAVSFGFYLRGQLSHNQCSFYILAQISGAIIASYSLFFLFPLEEVYGVTLPKAGTLPSFFIEFIMTYLLVIGIFVFSSSRRFIPYCALLVGGIVFLEAYFGGPFTGASMNPARSIAPALVSQNFDSLWLYVVAPITGSVFAFMSFQFLLKKKLLK